MSTTSPRPTVVVVRHGETEWSRAGRHTGRTDLPLTEEGRHEAREAGRLLDGRPFGLVLTSPLTRARTTCDLAGYGDEAELDDDLLEWDYGEVEGRTTADYRQDHPGWTVWDGDLPGGEAIADVAARADRVIARCLAADGDVALFGHGHQLRITMARWCELDPREGRRFLLRTATVSELSWEHEYRTIATLNQR